MRASTASSLASTRSASRASALALVFAAAFIVLFLAPPFLPYRFDPYPLIHWADVVDLATPLVLIPLYWLMLRSAGGPIGAGWNVVFLVFAAAWVEGHGIHLAANAIGHLLKDQPGPAQDLTEFWDERFGHYLWHSAALGLTALVLVRAARSDPAGLPDATTRGRAWMAIAGAVIYGFALFLIGDEGGTAPLMVAFAAGFLVAAWPSRGRVLASPVLTMLAGGYAVALLLFAVWFVYWGGRLPQFSELGWIK